MWLRQSQTRIGLQVVARVFRVSTSAVILPRAALAALSLPPAFGCAGVDPAVGACDCAALRFVAADADVALCFEIQYCVEVLVPSSFCLLFLLFHAVQEVDGGNLEAWEKAHHDLLTSQVRCALYGAVLYFADARCMSATRRKRSQEIGSRESCGGELPRLDEQMTRQVIDKVDSCSTQSFSRIRHTATRCC